MGRLDTACKYEHTGSSPGKNLIRRDWLEPLPRTADLISISHGILEVLAIMRWKGRIQTCDKDQGVRTVISEIRENPNGPVEYPDLNILPPGCGAQSTTQAYCQSFGVKRLAAVDLDLNATIKEVWPVARPVVEILQEEHYQGIILLTFRNGRNDGLKGVLQRIEWLQDHLPKGVQCVLHDPYQSKWRDRRGTLHIGSPMCLAMLKCI